MRSLGKVLGVPRKVLGVLWESVVRQRCMFPTLAVVEFESIIFSGILVIYSMMLLMRGVVVIDYVVEARLYIAMVID